VTPPGLRWAVVLARLDPTEGHEQAGRRPALVVSYEPFHRSGLITILPITSARSAPRYPGDVAVNAGTGGLERASVIICQPRTVSVHRIAGGAGGAAIGYLEDPELRRAVRNAVAHHFGLDVRPVRDGAGGGSRYA
jgi:mRNA interferase MazF